ncbi:MAG TPA: alpha/beta hydrolase [Terriglobales bacterium]|nr:alpha/beta hydrolase [Terriglobales bacterium]
MSVFGLVHGSTQNALGWALLLPQLERRGHRVICVNLPSDEAEESGTRYAQVIADSLPASIEAPIVVAHSVSGVFLPLLPTYRPVSRIVFLAAFVPEIGKSPMEQLKANPEMFWPDWIGKDPTKDDSLAARYLFHDCDPEITAWALTTLRLTHARRALREPCPLRSWPAVPTSYILCREDRTLRPDFWRKQVHKQLGIDPIELPGGHCPHVSHPRELAEVLSALASS